MALFARFHGFVCIASFHSFGHALIASFAGLGKVYGSLQVGTEMMNGIAFMDTKGSTCLYPFLRCAMWLGCEHWF